MDGDRAVNDRMTDLPVGLLAEMVGMITGTPASEIDDVVVIFMRKGSPSTGILTGIPAEVVPLYLIEVLANYGMALALDSAVDSVEIPDDLSDLS